MSLKSELLNQISGLHHGFGEIREPVSKSMLPYWQGHHPHWRQIHGTHCVEVLDRDQECGETDGLFTSKKNAPIGVITADCVPILLSKKDGTFIAGLHAGWRGTFGQITTSLSQNLKEKGLSLKDFKAAIGPSIRSCCFEVSEELFSDFKNKFQNYDQDLIAPSFRHLDLQELNRLELQNLGVKEVEILRYCTFCTKNEDGSPRFHSYRREQAKTRQWSTLILT